MARGEADVRRKTVALQGVRGGHACYRTDSGRAGRGDSTTLPNCNPKWMGDRYKSLSTFSTRPEER